MSRTNAHHFWLWLLNHTMPSYAFQATTTWMQGWKNGNSLEPWPQPWKLQLAMLSSVQL